MQTKFLICLPTYNESVNIVDFLTNLSKHISNIVSKNPDFSIEILNIDDNSPDQTAQIAASLNLPNFHQLNRSQKAGLGPAYLAGFKWGLERDYDYMVEMDADGSHHPDELERLLMASQSSDLVIGTRWMAGGSVLNWPWRRRFLSKLGTGYASWWLNLPFSDLTSGYRVISRDLVSGLLETEISSIGYGFQIEMVLKARKLGAAISQEPITFTERTKGRSKMTFGIVLEALKGITVWGLQERLIWLYRR